MGKAGHGLLTIFFFIEHPLFLPTMCAAVAALVVFAADHFSAGAVQFVSKEGAMLGVTAFFVLPLVALFFLVGALWVGSCYDGNPEPEGGGWEQYIEFKSASDNKKWAGKKIPIETYHEAYMNGEANIKEGFSFYDVCLKRNMIFRFNLTFNVIKFYVLTFLGQNFNHGQAADRGEIACVYNRGNDFYRWFLGETMIYTSGIFRSEDESLEDAQNRKLDMVCQQMQMKPGMQHLDIGCGWGTLISHAAKYYGTHSTGVTLAQEQAEWGHETASKYGISKNVDIWVMDYRDIPADAKFDVITCLEMAEHVGIKNFQSFLLQVKSHLNEDGLFYLQIAGLRRAWQYEDLVWGIFMGKYIFPAADASCPLGFVTSQVERAGYEVHRVENTGVHYSITIKRWYDNWVSNQEAVEAKYGRWWFRLWVVFLAWSAIIAAQGSSTVFMITLYKNHKNDVRSVSADEDAPFCRMGKFVGDRPIGIQQ